MGLYVGSSFWASSIKGALSDNGGEFDSEGVIKMS